MADEDPRDGQHTLLQPTIDLFVDSTRAVTDLVLRAGNAGARAVVPDPVLASVSGMLLSLKGVAEQFPHLSDEIDVLMGEVDAKRLSIQALTAELAVLDHQLEILQGTLAPVRAWSDRWSQLQRALLHALEGTERRDAAAPTRLR